MQCISVNEFQKIIFGMNYKGGFFNLKGFRYLEANFCAEKEDRYKKNLVCPLLSRPAHVLLTICIVMQHL